LNGSTEFGSTTGTAGNTVGKMKIDKRQMKAILTMSLGSVVILISGCAAGITRTGYQLPENMEAKSLEKCPIAIQRNAKYDSNDLVALGSIHSYDTGFSIDCDEAYTLDIFCKEGCMLGADLINITEEKQPDLWSTCYRAKAEFLRFKDREKVKGLLSDADYAPNLIIERSVKSQKRTREVIAASVLGGVLGTIVVWSATAPHAH
jgi:hypothetical protein